MFRIHGLDFFRGVAILLVLFSHIGYIYDLDYAKYFGIGRYGVVLFYIVSGYTIYYNLLNKEYNISIIIKFYIRRFFRIAPLFYLLLLIIYLTEKKGSVSAVLFVGYIDPDTFDRLLHVEWSIYVEMLFYFFAPFLFLKMKVKQHYALLIFFLISIMWRIVFYDDFFLNDEVKQYYYFYPVSFLYTFFIGSTLYTILNNKVVINKFILLNLLLLNIILILVLKYFMKTYFFLIGDYLFSIVFAIVFYIKFVYLDSFRLILFEYIGLISYSLYLWHYLVLKQVALIQISDYKFLDIMVATVVLGIISVISYNIIERTGIKIGRKTTR